jgi:hypothetical protein
MLQRDVQLFATIMIQRFASKRLAVVPLVILVAGCFSRAAQPQVSVTEMEPAGRAARAPDCSVPILSVSPSGVFRKVAIIEGWSDESNQQDLWDELKRRACEVGADALLVISDKGQATTHLVYDPANEDPENGGASASQNKGEQIIAKEHRPRIGEVGHTGHYIETYAIVEGVGN